MATPAAAAAPRRLLDPIDRISEVLFGLIMVLTFTGSLSVADAGRDDVRAMFIGALGCNLAWGIIDAIFYLMGCMAQRAGDLLTYRAVRDTTDAERARQHLASALPAAVAAVIAREELDALRERIGALPEPPKHAHLRREDWLGALAALLWVFATTFPVAVPFIVMESVTPAMRVSNGVAVAMLFLTGFAFGRCAGRNPWLTGGAMLLLGGALVAMTIALGG